MQKAIFAIIVLVSVLASSCNKGNYVPETFTFKGITYGANNVSGQTGTMIANVSNTINPSELTQLSCSFSGGRLPTTAGSYTVVSGTPRANQVALSLSFNSGQYYYKSTGGNGTQKIAISISAGQISMTGANITLVNIAGNMVDSSATFGLNLSQQ